MTDNSDSSTRESRRARLAADIAAQHSEPYIAIKAWIREWPELALLCGFAVGVVVARAVTVVER